MRRRCWGAPAPLARARARPGGKQAPHWNAHAHAPHEGSTAPTPGEPLQYESEALRRFARNQRNLRLRDDRLSYILTARRISGTRLWRSEYDPAADGDDEPHGAGSDEDGADEELEDESDELGDAAADRDLAAVDDEAAYLTGASGMHLSRSRSRSMIC